MNTYELGSGLEQAGRCFILKVLLCRCQTWRTPSTWQTNIAPPSWWHRVPCASWRGRTTREQRVGKPGSVHPYVIKKKKKESPDTHTNLCAQQANTDVTPAANANKSFVQTWKAKFINGDLYKSTRRRMMQLRRRSRKESVLCSVITQTHTSTNLLLGGRGPTPLHLQADTRSWEAQTNAI